MNDRPEDLLKRFLDAVADVPMDPEHQAEVVINLGKQWGLADEVIKRGLAQRLGETATEHPYFYWEPRARWNVGAPVRVIDGAPQALGKTGRVQGVDDPRRHGVRGMTRGHFFTVLLDDDGEAWGFREEQLEDG